MGKKRILKRQKGSSVKLYPYDPKKSLVNPKEILDTLLHCLAINDLEAFQDVLVAHIKYCSKTELSRKTKLGRRTLYDLLDSNKPFNPTLSTIGPLLKSLNVKRE